MRFVSLFGGIGGFDLGLTRTGHECVYYCDNDKYAVQTYNKNFGTNYEPTDIRQVEAKTIPEHDLLCAGFPCQAFSIAGKRKGFEDTRGTLFFEICRIIEHHRTPYLLLENVKGLLSHDEGKTFATILKCLDELGYDVEWQVLNSKHFGVPQNRERVFIVGCLRGKPRQKVFPIGEDAEEVSRIHGEEEIMSARCLDYRSDEGFRIREEGSPALTSHGDSAGGIPVPMVARCLDANMHRRITGEEGGMNGEQENDGRLCESEKESKEIEEGIRVVTLERKDFREHKTDGTPTLKQRMGTGGNNVPMVQGVLPVTATKRFHNTPKEINEYLKQNKKDFTIRDIAQSLKLPKTQVEHYFRTDNSRAVPSPEVWKSLKELLGFGNDYDEIITSVFEKEVEFEQTRRVYAEKGISPTLNTVQEPMIVARCLDANMHKGSTPESFYEKKERNLVPMVMNLQPRSKDRPSLKYSSGGSGTICKQDEAYCLDSNAQGVGLPDQKLRRLTPVECARLQGFPDDWHEGRSDTQAYKQYGNAVTVNVIEEIGKRIKKVVSE